MVTEKTKAQSKAKTEKMPKDKIFCIKELTKLTRDNYK